MFTRDARRVSALTYVIDPDHVQYCGGLTLAEQAETIAAATGKRGITLPNPASLALHHRFGFRDIGVYDEVGHKFGQYWSVHWLEKPMPH